VFSLRRAEEQATPLRTKGTLEDEDQGCCVTYV